MSHTPAHRRQASSFLGCSHAWRAGEAGHWVPGPVLCLHSGSGAGRPLRSGGAPGVTAAWVDSLPEMIRIVVALPGRSLSPLGQGAAAGFLVESEQSRDAATLALLVEVCDQLAEQGAKRPDTAQLRAGPRGARN